MFQRCVRLACLALIAWATLSAPVRAAGLDPSIATYILPQDIKWVTNAAGISVLAPCPELTQVAARLSFGAVAKW